LNKEDVKRVEEYLRKTGLITRIPKGHKKRDVILCMANLIE